MALFVEFRFFWLFFSPKKIDQMLFFFPRKSLQATHSAERRSIYKKRSKQVKNGTFCQILVFFVVFFSQKILPNSVFFFPGKIHPSLTPSIFRGRKKKTAPEKKNSIFTHSLVFPPKGANFKLFRGKKKYGTFDA